MGNTALSEFANGRQTHYRRSAAVVPFSDRKAGTAARDSNARKGASVSSESGLLKRVAAGDEAAVAACLDQFGGLVWSLARRLSPNEADAEDAVQEIFLEIWRFADRFDPSKASETTFVAMLARRRLIDRLRKHGRQPIEEAYEDHLEHAPSAEEVAGLGTDVARVAAALEGMKPEQQEAIRMSAWLGMSHSAIAEEMDLPLGTVKSHIRRGLIALREDLGAGETAQHRGTM